MTYGWDANNISSGLPNVTAESVAGTVTRKYAYGHDMARTTNGTTNSYLLADPVGTITHLVSSVGATQAQYLTGAYGTNKTTTVTDPNVASNPIRFTGQYTDPTTGNIHLRARQYNPTLGAFTQTDPLDRVSGDLWLSPYGYAAGNPASYSDPAGLREQKPGQNPIVFRETVNGVTSGRSADGKFFSISPNTISAPGSGKCKIVDGWKTKSRSECEKKAKKAIAASAKRAAKPFEKSSKADKAFQKEFAAGGKPIDEVKAVNDALAYFDMFDNARACYATLSSNDASKCTSLLTGLAAKASGGSLISLSPTVGFLIGFNVETTGSAVQGSLTNMISALSPEKYDSGRTVQMADGKTQLLFSYAGSLRIAQGARSKLIVDCGDGFGTS
jgi:RHS repeat-associated protein